MDISNLEKQTQPEEPRFLDFPHVPDGTRKDGKLVLNKYSSTITREHDFPGAQVRHPVCSFSLSSSLPFLFFQAFISTSLTWSRKGYAVCRRRAESRGNEE